MSCKSTIFSQLTSLLPQRQFQRIVKSYGGNKNVRSFSCWDQFLCMSFAQLTYRESLRDIESCLRGVNAKLYHLGIRGRISKSTLADANDKRDSRIYAEFAHLVIKEARELYVGDAFRLDLDNTVYALDATVIDLCLSLFPWAAFGSHGQAGIKIHTLLDLRGNIPTFIAITPRKTYELQILDTMRLEHGAFYVMDRGYFDWARLHRIATSGAFFVIRPFRNAALRRLYSKQTGNAPGIISDHIVMQRKNDGHKLRYPEKMRRIKFFDEKTGKRLTFITNHFDLPATTITELYKMRWQVELFFKWIKQHLRIKSFYGTSENAIKSQIWIAVTTYVLVAIAKKRLALPHSLYSILQVLSVTLREEKPILSVFSEPISNFTQSDSTNQLDLF